MFYAALSLLDLENLSLDLGSSSLPITASSIPSPRSSSATVTSSSVTSTPSVSKQNVEEQKQTIPPSTERQQKQQLNPETTDSSTNHQDLKNLVKVDLKKLKVSSVLSSYSQLQH